ncbi:MAG: hypothetical protein N2554_03995 [Fimbriimonadales bacterium]|nr:hypothetical protein [Fimbriimonadales bacterium]
MHRSMTLAVAGAMLCASFAFAGDKQKQLPLLPAEPGQMVMPQRMMKVKWENGKFVPVTPWIEVGDFAPAGPCSANEVLVFDHFGTDANGAPIGGSNCRPDFAPSSRWFFGPTYHNPYWANDIQTLVNAQYNGAVATSLTHAWFWNPLTSPERCIIIIGTTEQMDAECQDVHDVFDAPGRILDAVVLDYGPLAAGTGYYFSPVCLQAIGGLNLPATPADDGDPGTTLLGGYFVIYASAFDAGTGAVTYASRAQPMLWSMQDAGNIGSSTSLQWDDDTPTNGTHDAPGECFDYTYSVCTNPPRVLGGMMAFWVTPSCTSSPDINGNGCVDDADLLEVLFAFGSTGSPGIDGDANCDGIVDDADLLDVLFAFGTGC